MKLFNVLPRLKNHCKALWEVVKAERKNRETGSKGRVLFIFSRFHADPKNLQHKCGTGLTQKKILEVLQKLGYDVYFGGQEDFFYPENYIKEAKAIIYLAPALEKFLKYKPTAKLILWANNSHVLERNKRMRESAKKWGLPVESLGPEKEFLKAYEVSDYLMFSGNESCMQTFLKNGISKEKVIYWSNSVDTTAYRPSKEKFSKFTFVHWSSEIGLRKGLPSMLEAWKKWNNPNARLVLLGILTDAGKKSIYDALGKMRKDLPANVELLVSEKGFPAQDPFVLDFLGKSHVGVFPTLEDGQASVVLEMAASGLPVITTQESGYELNPDWSYEVKRDDTDSLFQAFERAYKDPQVLEKGLNAREFVKKSHSTELFKNNLEIFLTRVLG